MLVIGGSNNKMIRKLIEKLSGVLVKRSHSTRKRISVPIKLSFEPMRITGRLTAPAQAVYISGETSDLSSCGVAFVVSSIRVRENYLVGQDRTLNAEIDLPDGKIQMKVIGRRYERVGVHVSAEKYLIGAEIIEITKENREAYDHFLRFGSKRKKAASPSYGMGID